MGEKQRLRSLLKILFILYITFFISNLKVIVEKSILGNYNYLVNILNRIEIGIDSPGEFFMFQLIFISIFYYALKSSSNEIVVFEDINKEKKLIEKIRPYKIFVLVSILLAIYTIKLSKELNSVMSSVELVLISMLICYGKKIYIKSYLYDRKIKWLESINNQTYDETNTDTKKWRYKFWINKKETVEFKDKKTYVFSDIIHILIWGCMFILTNTILFKVIWGYFLICNILNLIENIFNLYTSLDGICTGVYETTSRNQSRNYYNIVVTDYNKKQEVEFKIQGNYNIEEMDHLNIVHGILTKKVLFTNNINLKKESKVNLIYFLIITFILIYPNIGYIKYHLNHKFSKTENIEQTLNYEDQPNKENIIEKLPKDEGQYSKIINTDKKTSFNGITVNVKKILLGKIGSKICFDVTNNSDKGMVINIDYNTHVKDKVSGENSNILLPKREYYIEMDNLEPYYNSTRGNNLDINLEYTLSETIIFDNEFRDYSYYNYYPLNVVDNNCNININLKNGEVSVKFEEYDQFYNKTNDVINFK